MKHTVRGSCLAKHIVLLYLLDILLNYALAILYGMLGTANSRMGLYTSATVLNYKIKSN